MGAKLTEVNINTVKDFLAEAKKGDNTVLNKILRLIKDDIYNLAIRMVALVEDAEDITQEVLIKIANNIDDFRGESSVKTWVYRITVNHILDRKKSPAEIFYNDFQLFGDDVLKDIATEAHEDQVLAFEVKYACTLAMLTCLDREHRAAYVIGEIFDLPGKMAAEVLEIEYDAYRQRLSRAKNVIETFTESYCGIVNKKNACRCNKKVEKAITFNRINPFKLNYATHSSVQDFMTELDELSGTKAIMQSHPIYEASEALLNKVIAMLNEKSIEILNV